MRRILRIDRLRIADCEDGHAAFQSAIRNYQSAIDLIPMRWPTYFILAYVAVAVQIGLSPYVAYHGAKPDLVLLAVIFIAMNAPRTRRCWDAFSWAFVQDLVTQQQPGLCSRCRMGWWRCSSSPRRQVVYKGHPLTHFTLALVGGLVTVAVLLSHSFVHPRHAAGEDGRSDSARGCGFLDAACSKACSTPPCSRRSACACCSERESYLRFNPSGEKEGLW